MSIFQKFLDDEDLLNKDEAPSPTHKPRELVEGERVGFRPDWFSIVAGALIFGLAFAARWYFIYHVGSPENAGIGWYGDTYHRWQIAYLTKEIGLKQGFLRIWDLKGMEYFWGIFHPLVTSFLFWITGSSNILILRFFSTAAGCITCVLLMLLGKRYFSRSAGLALGIFAALFPVAVFNDTTGSLEPIGVALILAGIYSWPKVPWLTGTLWALAAMSRAEAWLFSVGLVFACLLAKKIHGDKKVVLLGSWLVLMVIYMKILLDRTGNPIYPVWWNFLANAKGEWENAGGFTDYQVLVKPYFVTFFVVSIPPLIYYIIKRPRGFLLQLFGWGNIFFVSYMMGLSAYLKSVVPYFWMIRFFVWPYIFASGLVIWLVMGVIPKWLGKLGKGLGWVWQAGGWVLVAGLIAASFLTWPPIVSTYLDKTQGQWEKAIPVGKKIADLYSGGAVLFPEDAMSLLYIAVQAGSFKGVDILSQMYDPFAYEPFSAYRERGENYFVNWGQDRRSVMDWFKRERIGYLVMRLGDNKYTSLIKKEDQLFEKLGVASGYGDFVLYKVRWQDI